MQYSAALLIRVTVFPQECCFLPCKMGLKRQLIPLWKNTVLSVLPVSLMHCWVIVYNYSFCNKCDIWIRLISHCGAFIISLVSRLVSITSVNAVRSGDSLQKDIMLLSLWLTGQNDTILSHKILVCRAVIGNIMRIKSGYQYHPTSLRCHYLIFVDQLKL